MMVLATSSEYVFVPLDGPPGLDLTQFDVSLAFVPDDGAGTEPDTDAYSSASWIGGEAALIPNPGLAAGPYLVYARLVAPPEDVRLLSGRLRVGDTRT
jgi:hypothetical protein